MSTADEIAKLNELKQSGALTEEEFQKAKADLLSGKNSLSGQLHQGLHTVGESVKNVASNPNKWGALIHLSQFCGYILPIAGIIVPIVLWQLKKNESSIIDNHGRVVINWTITLLIYAVIFFLLSLFIIGIPFLWALLIFAIVFPIIGTVKAAEGKVWPYPCSIRFFKVSV